MNPLNLSHFTSISHIQKQKLIVYTVHQKNSVCFSCIFDAVSMKLIHPPACSYGSRPDTRRDCINNERALMFLQFSLRLNGLHSKLLRNVYYSVCIFYNIKNCKTISSECSPNIPAINYHNFFSMNLARAYTTRRNNIWFLCLCQIHRKKILVVIFCWNALIGSQGRRSYQKIINPSKMLASVKLMYYIGFN